MRSLAVVATLMFLGSTEARLFGKKNKKQVCGPCPNGAVDCASCTSSTVRTITEQTCTTCTKKVQQVQPPKVVPAPITYELVQKPVAYAIVQKPAPAYVPQPAPCACNQPSCTPCVAPKPYVPVVTCSITCTTADCVPCIHNGALTHSTPIPSVPVQSAPVPLAPASKTTVVVNKQINQPSSEIIVDGNGLVSVGGKTITA